MGQSGKGCQKVVDRGKNGGYHRSSSNGMRGDRSRVGEEEEI